MALSLEGWLTKVKKTPSPHEVTVALLETNPVLQCLREISMWGREGGICVCVWMRDVAQVKALVLCISNFAAHSFYLKKTIVHEE